MADIEKGYFPDKATQTAIKTVVDSTKNTVDTINNRTAGTDNTVNLIHSKVDTIINGRAVKSVQRGVMTTPNNSELKIFTATINSINPAKALVTIDYGGTTSGSSPAYSAYIENVSATSITIGFPYSYTYGGTKISWQVVEFY
ncbi:hypothetical protein [Lysinibacillus sphaericus]|uniref:hypothetical protein n=1 Tax=Lysinibacillus sphaericus TaxID=1421 RepID=UPI003D003BCD